MIITKALIFLLIVFLSFLQIINFSIFGVKPNLILAALVAVVFFTADIWEGLLLAAAAALILKFSPGFNRDILIFFLIAMAAVVIHKYLPWRSIINVIFLITVATLLFYVFSAPWLIVSSIFLKELIYNMVAGILIFILLINIPHHFTKG